MAATKPTNLMLAQFAQRVLAAKARYWYGTFGLKATTSLYNSKKGQYPSHYTAARAAQYKQDIAAGRWCCDCIGLIKWFFWAGGEHGGNGGAFGDNTRPAVYKANGFPDISANMCIQSHCDKTGPISTIPDVPGLVVWSSGHIGVYIGNGWVIEARGFNYGVVKTKVKDRPWAKWGKLKSKYLTYVDGSGKAEQPTQPTQPAQPADPAGLGSRVLKKGSKGADVKALQGLLIAQGYSCGSYGADGDFGAATDAAVRKYQKDKRLTVDGEAGPKTIGALLAGTKVETEQPAPTEPEQPAPEPANPVIIDISDKNDLTNKNVNWPKLKASVDLVIIRVGTTRVDTEPKGIGADKHFSYAVKKLVEHNIPFGVYWYNKIPAGKTAQQKIDWAKAEARKMWALASPYKPLFWCADVEESMLTVDSVKAFAVELRVLGSADATDSGTPMRVGMYVGNHMYTKFKAAVPVFDFIWIPHYGKNTGEISATPDHPCDIHQYTSVGNGKPLGLCDATIDLNRLMGTKTLGWFLGKGG